MDSLNYFSVRKGYKLDTPQLAAGRLHLKKIPTKESDMIVTTKKLFEHAYGKYAIGAYNINNLEQIVGLFKGNLDS